VDGPPDRQSRDTHSGFPPAADRPTSREREIPQSRAATLHPRLRADYSWRSLKAVTAELS